MKAPTPQEIAFGSLPELRSITFTILGVPIPLARPRMSGNHCWDSQKQQKLIIGLALSAQLKDEPLFAGPLSIDFSFFFPLPKRLNKRQTTKEDIPHIAKPDIDNCIKMYLDCASNDILYKDDCIIAALSAKKCYSPTPRTIMTISELFI